MRQDITIKRKDSTEDIGFISKKDPWISLSDYYGAPFKEYRRKWRLASNFELEPDFPLQLDFELNNNCNLKCEMCMWSVEKVSKVEYFPAAKFKEIVKAGVRKGLAALDLSFVNEPLIRRDIPDLIRFSRNAGILDIGFNTNAMLLTEDLSASLLDSGLTRIHFSIDAQSPEVYSRVRRGGDYNKCLKNVLGFLDKKDLNKTKGLLTAVSFVKMSVNEREWDDFVKFWKNRVDYIILREYTSPYGKGSRNFKEKEKLFASRRHIAKDFKCNKPWQRLIIRSDGTVLPCCVFQAVELPMGNVFEQALEDIWSSGKMRRLRQLHKNGEYFKNKTCLDCAVCSTGQGHQYGN